MAVHMFAVVGAPDSQIDFETSPEEFEPYVLQTLLGKRRHLSLLVKLVGDELAIRRRQAAVVAKEFFMIELYVGHGAFGLLAQETGTNAVVRIEVGDTIGYAHVSD